jgi:hypothetical protein
MKKLFFAILIIGAVAGIVLWVESRKTSKSPVIASEQINQVSSSTGSSSSTTVPGTALTTTYQPAPIGGSVEEIVDITLSGVLFANHYDCEISTDLSAYPGIEIDVKKVGANTVRVFIENHGLTTVTLPILTISALKLN